MRLRLCICEGGSNFNKCALDIRKNLLLMGATEITDLGRGDEDKASLDTQLKAFSKSILRTALSGSSLCSQNAREAERGRGVRGRGRESLG